MSLTGRIILGFFLSFYLELDETVARRTFWLLWISKLHPDLFIFKRADFFKKFY